MLNNKKAFSLIELSIVILIIGILVAGVTQGSRLISAMKLETARALTQSSPVNSIKGLFSWVETTGIDTIDVSNPDDNQVVTTWNDINPQVINSESNSFIQNSATFQPIYRTGIFNDLPAIRFDGGNDFMEISSVNSRTISANSENTLFFVLKSLDTSPHVAFSYESHPNNRIGLQFAPASPLTPRFDFGDADGVSPPGRLDGSETIGDFPVIITLEQKRGTQSLFVNGSLDNSQLSSATLTDFTDDVTLGKYSGGGFNSEIDVAEVIIFDHALRDTDRELIEIYLSKKWNIKISE
jgi:prepilin-type N-terminal cleavage/methylation domain-containing protein